MLNKLTINLAAKLLIALFSLVIVFHVLILLKVIPYAITWGGRLNNDKEMYTFESISIVINIILVLLILMKAKFMNSILPEKLLNGILWIFFGLFCLNTLGNLFAKTNFEKSFAVITLMSALFIWVILKKKEK